MAIFKKTLFMKSECENEQKIQAYIDEFYVVDPDNIRWFARTFGLSFFNRLKAEYNPLLVWFILQDTSQQACQFLNRLGIQYETIAQIILGCHEILMTRDLNELQRHLKKAGSVSMAAYLIEYKSYKIIYDLWLDDVFIPISLHADPQALSFAIKAKRKIQCGYPEAQETLSPARIAGEAENLLLAYSDTQQSYGIFDIAVMQDIRILDEKQHLPKKAVPSLHPSWKGRGRGTLSSTAPRPTAPDDDHPEPNLFHRNHTFYGQ